MEILHNLTYIVSDLSRRSEEILKEGVELLKNFDPIVVQVLSVQTHLRKDRVAAVVQEEIIALLCDAQNTQNEIESFAAYLTKGEQVNTVECPFLAKVWHGDMYGTTGTEGLHALMEDLNKQYSLLVGNEIIGKISEALKLTD